MNQLIERNREELERICRKYRVQTFELFGSASGGNFNTEKSDLDFLVTFQELGFNDYADAYFGLLEDLQRLFQRQIDLVTPSAIQNPYFREAVEATRTVIYAA